MSHLSCLLTCALFLLKLVRPGMQIPARLPRAPLNPIPPQNATTAAAGVVGVQAMTPQVFIPSVTSDLHLLVLLLLQPFSLKQLHEVETVSNDLMELLHTHKHRAFLSVL